ncbi:MAG: GNAT family N-acetyltransferase [Mycobacteriales bacterium]
MTDAIRRGSIALVPIDAATAARILDGDLGALDPGTGWPQADTIEGIGLELQLGGSPACWLIQLAGTVIGELGWKGGPGQDGAAEVGYSIAPDYRGAGHGSAAVAAFVDWACGEPRVRRLVAETRSDNIASQRVLQKAGFAPDRSERGYIYWVRETAAS